MAFNGNGDWLIVGGQTRGKIGLHDYHSFVNLDFKESRELRSTILSTFFIRCALSKTVVKLTKYGIVTS